MAMKTCVTCKQEKPDDAYRGSRGDCRECEREKHRAWYARQEVKPYTKPELKVYWQTWYEQNSASVKARAVEWSKFNPEKRLAVCKVNMRRQREKLSDCYVRRVIAASIGLKAEHIPQPLVEVQRELMKLKRATNEKL
jgi:hypothetical protein